MTLATLLEELKEVDVKVYDDIEVSRCPTEEFTWYDLDADESIHMSVGEAVGRIARDSPQYQYIIQGCIQRACERPDHQWPFHVAYYPPEGPTAPYYQAYIWPALKCYTVQADTAAEALLAAYIAAVPVEAKR